MQNHKPHSQKAPQTGHSIFGTILFSLLAVLAVEFLLLTFAVHATRLGPQLNQNAEDILAMQVDNRSRYLQSIFHDAQELTSLSDAINGLTQQLLDEGEISLSTLDSSSDAAYPLLEAAAPELISTLRIKSVTGVFLILNTHNLDKRKQDSLMPAIYLRDLDPDAAPSQRNADLTFVRAPAQLVQSLSIATDNSWSPTIRYRALGNRGFLYPPFQAAYKDGASLAASDYGHWTSQSYLVPGDTHEAIAYSQPLILPDGTVYGVIGVELLADYLWENLPCSELQNNGTYFLAVTDTEELSASELQLRPVLRSHCDGQPGSADESLTLRLHSAHTHRYLFSNALYIASVSPLNLYSRNAPFSGKHWLLVGSVPAVQLFAFAQRLKQLFSFIMLITLAVGFVCSWLVSRRLARPVAKLSAEVAAAEADSSAIPHLSATGIRELDQFSSAFTQLSKDVLDSSTRFLRIMKLASAELGGYELRDDSVYVTDNFFSMLGLAQEQPDPLTPKAFRALMGTLEQRWFYRLSPANNKVFAIPQPDGSTHYITLRITHILGESASEVGLAEDMTTTVLEQQRIEHERDYDTLTGLYRRRAFDRACEALFQQPEKLGCAALLMMDLDNLKQINDTYGHDWGDQYIHQTGQCFAANAPKNTVCSRLSGDEFLLLFYGYDTQDAIRAELGAGDRTVILSFGGSLGARRVNEVVADLCAWEQKNQKPVLHLHATGQYGVELFQNLEKEKGFAPGDSLVVKEYINNMPELLAAADLVISRAGALTLAELEAVGRAAILIPSPNVAENHQYYNAMELQKAGAAVVIEEKDLTGEKLVQTVSGMLAQPGKLAEMGRKARSLSVDDSLDRIADALLKLVKTP